MRKQDYMLILEKGDALYRYILMTPPPQEWSTCLHNPEYDSIELGPKNIIGAFFFYDTPVAAKKVLAQAIVNQQKIENNYTYATVTCCLVTDDIILLNLESGILNCCDMISALNRIGINIVSSSFYNYKKHLPFSSITSEMKKLNSGDKIERETAANSIESFFCYPPYLGQTLTDFNNGPIFKNMLKKKGLEGYVFMELLDSNTYCLFDSNKLTAPNHSKIVIANDAEIQKFIKMAI